MNFGSIGQFSDKPKSNRVIGGIEPSYAKQAVSDFFSMFPKQNNTPVSNNLIDFGSVLGLNDKLMNSTSNIAPEISGIEVDPESTGGLFNWSPETLSTVKGITDIGKTGLGAYLGRKQLGNAKDFLNFQKQTYAHAKAQTNADIATRQAAQREATGKSNIQNVNWS